MALKIADLIFFGRPILIIPVWTVYLHFTAFIIKNGYCRLELAPHSIIHLIFLTLIFKGVYVLNQIYDIETDRLNDKLFFLTRNIISIRTAWIYYIALSSAGLLLAIGQSISSAILAGSIILLGLFYSIPEVKFKDRPIAGLLANGIGFGILVPLVAASDIYGPDIGAAIIPYFMAITAGYILTTIPDMDGDAAAGKKTVAVILGPKTVLWLALLASLATLATSILAGNYEMLGVSFITAILILILLITFNERLLLFTSKFPILILTLMAAAHYPLYLLILLLTIALTRFYYKKKFDIIYPQLG
jgi:4-hydroxybenzoate polyprenyltransferase